MFKEKYNVGILDLVNSISRNTETLLNKSKELGVNYKEFVTDFLAEMQTVKVKGKLEIGDTIELDIFPTPKKLKKGNIFDNIKGVTGKDKLQPIMQGVYFEEGNAIATDAYKLVILKNKTAEEDIIKQIKISFAKNEPNLTRAEAEEKLDRYLQGTIDKKVIHPIIGAVIDGIYPHYKNVILTDELKSIVGINANDFLSEVNGAVHKKIENTFLRIGAFEGWGCSALYMQQIVEALIKNGAETLTFSYFGIHKILIIKADNGDMGLLVALIEPKGIIFNSIILK